ncbi:hypothetical protein EYF80_005696 [Liparis tanakae]|uniref:Uncharacterized protein n=1 Tax=Liparis tanakae TaxID=230148 RepID=A0A4Z2J1E6_9TELE|nr:hypothetical protein EYF80_005696 [Liparis tanakae]
MHSLKPARYFPKTVGSVLRAAAEKTNFPPIRARDTRPKGGRLVVGVLPLVVWPQELAANGARPGFRAQPGKLPAVFNHRTVYILTVEPLTGTATRSGHRDPLSPDKR